MTLRDYLARRGLRVLVPAIVVAIIARSIPVSDHSGSHSQIPTQTKVDPIDTSNDERLGSLRQSPCIRI